MSEPSKSDQIREAVKAIRTELQIAMGGVPETVEQHLKKIEEILTPAS